MLLNPFANSPLARQIFFTKSGVRRMTTTKQHDFLNRLTAISSVPSGSSVVSFAYQYNDALPREREERGRSKAKASQASGMAALDGGAKGFPHGASQRTCVTLADGSFWVYSYDSLGQVTSGKKYWSDGTPVAGQQFEYGFDHIGNRQTTAAGGVDI